MSGIEGAGRVLIIDDDDHIRELLQTWLELHGFEVETLSDGIDALAPKDDYDAIVLDVQMPVFDGDRLTEYWMMTDPALLDRVIIMTAFSRGPRWPKPAFAVVPKPFQFEQMVSIVAGCVAQARARRTA